MQSSEFPQFPFVRARSYTGGRVAGQPTVIIIHATDGSEGRQSAEDGAAYDQVRPDGTSTHFFVDQDSAIQTVYTWDEAHAARTHGNDVGIQIEICGRASQTADQWEDEASAGAIEQAARVCVAIRAKYGQARFPLRRLTPMQLRNGGNGFAGHVDATYAWPSDQGTHTDPGSGFPWSTLFNRIAELEAQKENIVTDAQYNGLINAVKGIGEDVSAQWGAFFMGKSGPTRDQVLQTDIHGNLATMAEGLAAIGSKLDAIIKLLTPTSGS